MRRRIGTHYRELLNGLDVIVWEADPETLQFTFVSQGAERLLGYPLKRWQQEPSFLANHLQPEDRDKTLGLLQEAKQQGHNCVLEYRMVASDGSVRWLRNVISADVARSRRASLKGVMVDVTQSKQVEEERAEAQSRLARDRKLKALAGLAGGVAHDFNNILMAVQGYCDLTKQDLDSESPLQWNLNQIARAAERGANLTGKLLLASCRYPLELSPLSMNMIAEDLARISDQVDEQVSIDLKLQPDLWMVRVDREQLLRAIENLLTNAADAMPAGGTITIEMENLVLGEDRATLMLNGRPGKFVRVSVVDTGTGMTEEVIEHLYEPFFTTKPRGKGKGLGLAVAHGIVAQHGGWLNAASQPGHGTTFQIYLPAEG